MEAIGDVQIACELEYHASPDLKLSLGHELDLGGRRLAQGRNAAVSLKVDILGMREKSWIVEK